MSLLETAYRKFAKRHFSHLALQSLLLVITVVPIFCGYVQSRCSPGRYHPPTGLPMYGYFDRIKNNQLASGTLDPLYARVLVLETVTNGWHWSRLTSAEHSESPGLIVCAPQPKKTAESTI